MTFCGGTSNEKQFFWLVREKEVLVSIAIFWRSKCDPTKSLQIYRYRRGNSNGEIVASIQELVDNPNEIQLRIDPLYSNDVNFKYAFVICAWLHLSGIYQSPSPFSTC